MAKFIKLTRSLILTTPIFHLEFIANFDELVDKFKTGCDLLGF